MITHHGVGITINEQRGFDEGDYTVSSSTGLVFKAASVYGKSYARTPELALEGAKRQIDNASSK